MTYTGRSGARWLAALMSGAVLLGGCGDDDDPSAPAATATGPAATQAPQGAAPAQGEVVKLTLDATERGGLAFSEEALQAAAGQVALVMGNPPANTQQHAIAILGGNGQSVAGQTVPPGGTSEVTANLVAGDYTFFCPVGNHRAQGMEGVLVVE